MAGFDLDRARTVLGIPATHEPVAATAVGYPSTDPAGCAPALHARDGGPRTRKPLNDMVFTGRWGVARGGR